MSLISILQIRSKPWAQAVLTVFVLAWLNLTLQQCVLAASTISESSLPPAAYDISGQSQVFTTPANEMDNCPDCVTLGGAGCSYEISCAEPGTYMASTSITVKKVIQPGYVMIFPPVYRAIAKKPCDFETSDAIPTVSTPYAGPSLNVRYCVYLK